MPGNTCVVTQFTYLGTEIGTGTLSLALVLVLVLVLEPTHPPLYPPIRQICVGRRLRTADLSLNISTYSLWNGVSRFNYGDIGGLRNLCPPPYLTIRAGRFGSVHSLVAYALDQIFIANFALTSGLTALRGVFL